MEGTAQLRAVYAGLAAVRDHLAKEGLGKNQTNQHQKFKFRGIDDLYGILQPALAVGNIVMAPSLGHYERKEYVTPGKADGAPPRLQFYTVVTVEYRFTSLVDGSEALFSYAGEAADTGDKSLSKALTMAFKSFCFHVFQIPLNGNDDADKHVADETAAQPIPQSLRDDLEFAAEGGTKNLRAVWNALPEKDRDIVMARDQPWWESVKEKAKHVKPAA
jgi:hypothetical protein